MRISENLTAVHGWPTAIFLKPPVQLFSSGGGLKNIFYTTGRKMNTPVACCERCASNDCCNYFMLRGDVIMSLCYDCSNLYSRDIMSRLLKKATHYVCVFTGISYPF